MAGYTFSFSSNLYLANYLPPKVTIALILECLFYVYVEELLHCPKYIVS